MSKRKEQKAAWMDRDIHDRYRRQKHILECESMASILAEGVKLLEEKNER